LIIGSLKEKTRRPLSGMSGIASGPCRVGLLFKTYLNALKTPCEFTLPHTWDEKSHPKAARYGNVWVLPCESLVGPYTGFKGILRREQAHYQGAPVAFRMLFPYDLETEPMVKLQSSRIGFVNLQVEIFDAFFFKRGKGLREKPAPIAASSQNRGDSDVG